MKNGSYDMLNEMRIFFLAYYLECLCYNTYVYPIPDSWIYKFDN